MTKVTIDETTYSVTVAEENVNVTVADTSETLNIQIASAASDSQVLSGGAGTSLVASSTGGITTMKSVVGGDNVSLSDDGSTITISATEDDLSNNTTDNLAEGTTNLYYTDARVQTKLADVSGHIIPDTDNAYDLGSTTHKWRSMYLSGGSLYIDGHKIIGSDETGDIDLTTDPNQNLNVQAGGTITMLSSGQTTTIQDNTVNLGPATNVGNINARGTLDVAVKIEMGDLDITSGQLHQDSQNGDLILKTNGTGKVIADTSNLVVGTLQGNNTQITPTGITGDVTGTVSSIANHNTDALSEGSTNLYYTDAKVQSVIDTNTAGFITDYTVTQSDVTQHQAALSITESQISDLSHFSGNYNDLTNKPTIPTNNNQLTNGAGYITDYTVTESDVTQHQAALSITESQISDLTHYTDSDARSAVSLNSSNTNELSYDSSTGVFSYTSPSTVAATGQVVFDVRNASGVAIARGDAVYIAGHSGGKILVAKADANVASTMPAIGLANSAMDNNTDGSVLVGGEMTSLDTSAFSVGDVLYVSETAGELTATRPSAEATKIQNIGKVARSDNQNGIIIVVGSGRANDVPNLAHKHVFIGDTTGYETRQLDTSDITEDATNLFYTDARVQSVIDTNTAGFITDYTVTQSDVTQHQAALAITESQITDLSHYTNAQAISAVEGEATLDLTGDVTISQDLDVTGLITVDDGYSFSTFNPYGMGTSMPTTVMGVGQESGWAGITLRSRGEHDWGLSGFGIPASAPRALVSLSSGRLDGSSDDYLNSGDKFASVVFNPYSAYRTGTEWLTPSVELEVEATENHSATGMGAKLVIHTTENGNYAGSTDTSHSNKRIEIQGTTLTTSDTLKIDDDLTVTGNIGNEGSAVDFDDPIKVTGNVSSKTATIGDFESSSAQAYANMGMQIDAGDTSWPTITFKEYAGTDGGGLKPVNLFTNPGFETEVFGGTPSSPAALGDDKRIVVVNGTAANASTLPQFANIRFLGLTVGDQSSTNRGSKWQFQTTPENATGTQTTVTMKEGNVLQLGNGSYESGHGIIQASGGDLQLGSALDTNGNNIVNTSGDVRVNDSMVVTGNLDVDGLTELNGDVNLGDANTDTITVKGKLNTTQGFRFTVMDVSTANYLSGVLGIVSAGDAAYISDGDAGSPCLGVYDGSNWKVVAFGNTISSS